MNHTEIEERVNEIFSLYNKYGNEEYGEGVTQLMHMVQAGNLALKEGYDEEMVLAAFFHDIGHFLENGKDMEGYGKHDHDRLGYEYLLQKGFSQRVASLVASHVPAKRYLAFKDKEYLANLSEASTITLGFQGGPMSADEAAAFEADPLIKEYIKIRLWDDLAKETNIPVNSGDVEYFRQMTINYLAGA
jgi:2-amino-1-hydroxyethylphosphonate dioxygenase (glycine-forming)